MNIEEIKQEILTQDNRWTSWVIFIIVEDKKVYRVDSEFTDDRERKDSDTIDPDHDLCESCQKLCNEDEIPDECENWECEGSFINFRIEKNVPNLYAGFFFTAKAAEEHLKNCKHHYNSTAKTYGISAYHNEELKTVLRHLVGEENAKKLQ